MLADRYRWTGHLVELMRSMTHREFLARLESIREQEATPSRGDWYAMQIAAEVRRSRFDKVKNPPSVSLKDLKLEPEGTAPEPGPVTREEAARRSMARWGHRLGIKQRR